LLRATEQHPPQCKNARDGVAKPNMH
jgi:hypothetical protein